MNFQYSNMPVGSSKLKFALNHFLNVFRTWYVFNFKFPFVKYNGFVRVMKDVRFAKGRKIVLGHKVQIGKGSRVATDLILGNHVLIAGNVSFVGRNDHTFTEPGISMWDAPRGKDEMTYVGNDVWVGNGAIILAGVKISSGSIVAAGSLVNKSIPHCEIWGGVPAKKIRDRFQSSEQKKEHLEYLNKLSTN
ncbi:acyltransferase [Zunongwangia sp. HRR-M8]|uniref:acyltransferase n=1 Tax=Zunongwangia sp. HRR-M8 TaxID=3015170 RepID=UPI0022DD286C|nr:acyltransferase [Zunongwangia sp. HRR-M8]WBL22043.1 acyltransferase [Zunongwangia sp. HRR-M8]